MTTANEPTDERTTIEPPPFQASDADKEATRKRKALFLRQSLLLADRFSRNPVSYTMLASAIPWLEREQYDNIAVERNANGHCGYILCSNPLGNPISQLYRINCSTRRVFDLTQRKPFCSDWCYSASKHVRKQIPTEPGWCRPQAEGAKELTLLPKYARSRPGKLVLDGLRRLRISSDDEHEPSESESSTEKSNSERSSVSDPSESDVSNSQSDKSSRDSSPIRNLPCDEVRRLVSKKTKTGTLETAWGVRVELPKHNLIVEHSSLPDVTEVSRPMLPNQPVHHEDTASTNSCPDLFIGVKTRLLQWLSRKAFRMLTHPTQSPLSDVVVNEKAGDAAHVSRSSSPPPGVLPLIDSVSVDTMRRQLLMEELLPSVNAILSKMYIPARPILSMLENSVAHFRLTSKNLHVSRVERSLISLALLRLMAPSHQGLSSLADTKQLASLLETMTTKSCSEFLDIVIHPLIKHFEE